MQDHSLESQGCRTIQETEALVFLYAAGGQLPLAPEVIESRLWQAACCTRSSVSQCSANIHAALN